MDATYLSGNEWIIYLYVTVSNIFLSSSMRREIVWMPLAWVVMYGSTYLDTKVRMWVVRAWPSKRQSRGELDVVTGTFTCYTHVYLKVLNCGLVGMTVYTWACFTWVVCCNIYSGIYIGVFSFQPRDQTFIYAHILLLGWAEMKLFCRYITTNA